MKDLLKALDDMTKPDSRESGQEREEITPTTELIMSGILDSLNITTLVAYLERRIGSEISIGDLDLMKLSTPKNIQTNFLASELVQ